MDYFASGSIGGQRQMTSCDRGTIFTNTQHYPTQVNMDQGAMYRWVTISTMFNHESLLFTMVDKKHWSMMANNDQSWLRLLMKVQS